MSTLNSWWEDLCAVLFPPTCAVCGRLLTPGERAICTACRVSVPLTDYWLYDENPVAKRFHGVLPVEQASAFLLYQARWRRPFRAFKYSARWRLATELGRWYGAELAESGRYDGVEAVVPVPLHPLKLLARGYNQADYLAEAIARGLGVPVERGAVRRIRHAKPQARLPERERAANVAGAFRVVHPERLAGRHLLLVDDVVTTGSTLTSLGEAILAAAPDCRLSIAALGCTRRY